MIITKKPLWFINKFSKASEHKINIQRSSAYLYVYNKLSEREVKKRIPPTNASKRTKYLRIKVIGW